MIQLSTRSRTPSSTFSKRTKVHHEQTAPQPPQGTDWLHGLYSHRVHDQISANASDRSRNRNDGTGLSPIRPGCYYFLPNEILMSGATGAGPVLRPGNRLQAERRHVQPYR